MRILLLFLISLVAFAQPVPRPSDPHAKPSDYQVHTRLQDLTLAADFLGHSFSGPSGMFATEDYLVIDVALYPDRNTTLAVAHSHFTLRLNGKKVPLMTQPAQFVAASLKYEDWTLRPTLTATAGVGDAGVILGRPESRERFPGDPRPQQRRLPNPPSAPTPEDRSGIDRAPPPNPAEICVEQSLPEAEITGPLRGYIYFPFRGNLKSIRKAELLYSRGGVTTVLALR